MWVHLRMGKVRGKSFYSGVACQVPRPSHKTRTPPEFHQMGRTHITFFITLDLYLFICSWWNASRSSIIPQSSLQCVRHVSFLLLLTIRCCLYGWSVLVKRASKWFLRVPSEGITGDGKKCLDGHLINLSSSVILPFHHRSSSPYLRTPTSAMGITSFLSGNQHSLRIHISYKCKHKVSSTFQKTSVPLFDESLQWLQYRLCICVHSHTQAILITVIIRNNILNWSLHWT